MLTSLTLYMVFCAYVAYKDFKYPHGRWLVGLILSFVLSVFALFLYSIYFWDFYYLRSLLLDVTKPVWVFVYSLGLSSYTVSRLLNLGTGLFLYCALSFSMAYTHFLVKSKWLYLLVIFFPLQYVVFYDPYLQNIFYSYYCNLELGLSFHQLLFIIDWLNRGWFYCYLGLSTYLLMTMLLKIRVSYIRFKALGITTGIISIFLLFLFMFNWIPKNLVILRGELPVNVNGYFYENYVSLSYAPSLIQHLLFPMLTAFSILSFLYAFYRYNAFELLGFQYTMEKNQVLLLENASSAMNHVVKNKLVEIKTVTELDLGLSHAQQLSMISEICDGLLAHLDSLGARNKTLNLHFKHQDLALLVQDFAKTLNCLPPHIQLTWHIPLQSHYYCYGDGYYIKEILLNLVKNAREAMGDQTGTIHLCLGGHRGFTALTVENNGPPIPTSSLVKIFEPFFSTKPSNANWGIGLSYCKKIMDAHNGKITVESHPSKTTFSLLFPSVLNLRN